MVSSTPTKRNFKQKNVLSIESTEYQFASGEAKPESPKPEGFGNLPDQVTLPTQYFQIHKNVNTLFYSLYGVFYRAEKSEHP